MAELKIAAAVLQSRQNDQQSGQSRGNCRQQQLDQPYGTGTADNVPVVFPAFLFQAVFGKENV